MSKIKKIVLALLISCFAVCSGLAIAACTDKNAANFRMPPDYENGEKFNGNYTVYVKSAGGMSLNNVKVSFRRGGTSVTSGVSKSGRIDVKLNPDIYQLSVDADTLPEGYFLDNTQYYTKADEGEVTIKLNSRIIETTATSSTVYSEGDVMYDFGYVDALTDTKHTLSELLYGENAYKAVMLNFFFVGCGPCRLEFPAIEEAYQAYKDKIAIVALSNQDSAAAIKSFAQQTELNFHLGYDSASMTSKFNVSAFPTTVIVDRYGVVATIDRKGGQFAASYWRTMFQHYTSDSYEQSDKEENPDETPTPTEFTRPTEGLVMPDSDKIDAALTGIVTDGASVNRYYPEEGKDKEYSWPWLIKDDDGTYLDASNKEFDYSFSTLYAELSLTPGDAISYEYNINTEADYDNLYVFVNGSIVGQYSGDSNGWKEDKAVYIANRNETVELAFMYYKNLERNVDNERASIRNLNIRPVKEVAKTVDQQTLLVNDLTYDESYNNPLTGGYNVSISKNTENGYYYVTKNGTTTILLADILNSGFWAEKHLGSTSFIAEEKRQVASVYLLSYWKMSNYERADKTTPLIFDYLTDEQSEILIEKYYLQSFSDNGLLPVTDDLIELLNAFIDGIHKNHPDMLVEGDKKYDGQWLEFCYYYIHYGADHSPDDKDYHECYKTLDPIKGLVYSNALPAYEGTAENPVANEVNITKIMNLGDGGGIKFKFVPSKTGVYLFYSKAPTAKGVDPKLYVYSADKELLLETDNDMRYNSPIFRDTHDEYYDYVWLEANKTYYLHGAMSVPNDTGTYEMYIEYQGADTVSFLRYATTGDGMFTYTTEPPVRNYYLAVNTAFNSEDGIYYHYTDDFKFGSKIYIDFIHENYLDRNGNSLYKMIENGVFDFRKNGGANYTATMRTYYRKAIANSGELYGLTEADQTLVNILSFCCQVYLEENAASGAWEMFACYYQYIGDPAKI